MFGGCVFARLAVVYYLVEFPWLLKFASLIYLIIASFMLYFYATRTRMTGLEVGGGEIWWNNWRPVHAIIYIIFAVKAYYGQSTAHYWLLGDIALGIILFLRHYVG